MYRSKPDAFKWSLQYIQTLGKSNKIYISNFWFQDNGLVMFIEQHEQLVLSHDTAVAKGCRALCDEHHSQAVTEWS